MMPDPIPKREIRIPESGCSWTDRVARFLSSATSEGEEELAALAAHLDDCEACQRLALAGASEATLEDDLQHVSQLRRQTLVDVNVPLARLNDSLVDYEIIEELGRGGMGIVYKARQLELDRLVALKVLPALLGVVRPDAIARFRREAAMAARLKHTNIIAVHDFGEVDGTFYYTMELIEGRSLRDVLREIQETGGIDVVVGEGGTGSGTESGTRQLALGTSGDGERATEDPDIQCFSLPPQSPLAPNAFSSSSPSPQASGLPRTRLGSSSATDKAYYRRVAEWTAEVAEALHYAHEHGVVHRDVKPSNLLLANDGRMMISDLGLARAAGAETLTASHAVLGTARYMSPEQVGGDAQTVDHRIDVYGLGATLYELLAFRPMFAAADDREVLYSVLNKEPAPPRRFVRYVPSELETICLKAIEKDRANRYATAKALRDDLQRWLLNMPILARRPSLPTRVGKFVRRRKLPAALGAALIVVLAVAAVLLAGLRASSREAAMAKETVESQAVQLLVGEARQLFYLEGDYQGALAVYERGLTLEPESAALQHGRASVLRFLKRSDEAVEHLEAFLSRHPDEWKCHSVLALAYDDLGDEANRDEHRRLIADLLPDSAQTYYILAAESIDPAEAVTLLTRALELRPDTTEFLINRAWRYYALKQHDAMLMDAQQLAGMHPNWSFIHGMRGLALFDLGRFAEAERAYDRQVKLDPDSAKAWHNRGASRLQVGEPAESLADANEAIRLHPDYALAYFTRAKARAKLGDLKEALADCDRSIKLDPTDIQVHHEKSFLLGSMGRWEESAIACTVAIQQAPDDVIGYANRGVANLETRQFDRAIVDFTAALRLNPSDVRLHRSRAYAYFGSGCDEKAVADFSAALDMEPDFAEDYHNRALCLVRLERYVEAAADLTRLHELRGGSVSALIRRGVAYELAGEVDKALDDYGALVEEPGPAGDYATIWHSLLLKQSGQHAVASQSLARREVVEPDSAWIARLFEFYRGEMSPESLLAVAVTDDERAEAHYYIGRQALLDGAMKTARTRFTRCIALNRIDVLETDFARALLKKLADPDPQPNAAAEVARGDVGPQQ